MQEFWFCSQCMSMNRASSRQCYKCRAPRQTATLATVSNRQEGVVLTPGLDEEHRDVAWALMAGQNYVSPVAVGYLATALIMLTAIAWVFLATMGMILLVGNEGSVVSTVTDGQVHLFWVGLAAFGVSLAATALVHGVFLGLASMNAAALGSGTPRYGMLRSGLWWVESFGWTILAWLVLGGPYLGLALFSAPGMVLGVLWLAVGWYLMGNPISFLGRPRRLLDDLWGRLSVPGSGGDARTVSLWSLSWGTARGLVLAYYAFLTLLGVATFIVLIVAALSGHGIGVTISDNYVTIATLLDALAYGSAFVAETIAYLLLAQVTLGLVDRLKARERWVRAGPRKSVESGGVGGNAEPASPAPNQPYEYMPPEARVAPAPATFSTEQWPAPAPSTPEQTPPDLPARWPRGPIMTPISAPDAEPPRFDPRAWVPPRPVVVPPPIAALVPESPVEPVVQTTPGVPPAESTVLPPSGAPAPVVAPAPSAAAEPITVVPDVTSKSADDMGWGEGL